ncbi:ribosomal protein S5 domain 2-type protein [Lineolata rhizophorae]|uniref:Ribosomal protein S5 domain 2-type protein n=1 Tax=Lineolata rhizophorae TaxID=578093 RepID=A0A6A6NVM9_9PEZI|nr:ribosomal protein S5 domain 2-type protein [Lineolata rhizophorae]
MNSTLSDELVSINSIYDPSTLVELSPTTCALRLPSNPSISLRIEFPIAYPDEPPTILGTQSVAEKGTGAAVVDISRTTLSRIFQPGEPCVYDLVEELSAALPNHQDEDQLSQANASQDAASAASTSLTTNPDQNVLGPAPPWVLSEPLTEKRSVFLARAAHVTSPSDAKAYVAHLIATDKKAARATHNMTAWRIRGAGGTAYQDCDDDGETASGGRLLHLLQLMDVWDVVVVVSRWFGGVLLGPDRFRIINAVAREAVIKGEFGKEAAKEVETKGGGKKKGKK